jgi:hypothetical protein
MFSDRPGGLHVWRRRDSGTLQIVGTVAGQRVRRRASTDDVGLARREAAEIEREMLGLPEPEELLGGSPSSRSGSGGSNGYSNVF